MVELASDTCQEKIPIDLGPVMIIDGIGIDVDIQSINFVIDHIWYI